jgi:hypothetical protein
MADGQLFVGANALSAKGKPLPESLQRHVRAMNFAQELNRDPEARAAIEKLDDIRIKDDRLVIDPK